MKLRDMLAKMHKARNKNGNSSLSVIIGGEHIAVHPLRIEGAVEIVLLMAPYVATFSRHETAIAAALAAEKRSRDHTMLRTLISAMMTDMEHLPGDVVRMLAIFLDLAPEWVANNATALELVGALPAIDKANDLGLIMRCTGMLGFIPGLPTGDDDDG